MDGFLWWTGAIFWGALIAGAVAINVAAVVYALRGGVQQQGPNT